VAEVTTNERHKFNRLRSRVRFLDERIASVEARELRADYDRAERAAIQWALRVIQGADERGILEEVSR
jgi:hypothetical protein